MAFSSHKTEPKPLVDRVQKARTEGRTQQALELVKQLAKQEPTPEHQLLLRSIIFERGCQLLNEGKVRDAIVVFNNAKALDAPPEYRAAVAGKFAQLGDVGTAMAMFAQLAESPERARAFEKAVDGAIVKGAAGRAHLPPDLHAGFDAVIAAAGHIEQARDEAVREALQPIGLSSPFLEWKVMLRGLAAYYQKDDARAIDNWQRLSPERQPWRLIAPYRLQIDSAFRAAQPDATRQRLRTLLERLAPSGLVKSLQTLQAALMQNWTDERSANEAFREAKSIYSSLKHSDPALARRIADDLYVKIAHDGTPDDVPRYIAAFGGPADDPNCHRLSALVGERDNEDGPPMTIDGWSAYEKELAKLPHFTEPEKKLARALVWERLGDLVSVALGIFKVPKEIPRPDECFRKSIALVPTRLKPYELLLAELRRDKKHHKKAVAAAKMLVEEFPDHANAWEFLGDDDLNAKKPEKAIAAFRAALKADPMRRELRRKLGDAVWAKGIKLATPPKNRKTPPSPDEYRPILEESIRYTEGSLIARYAAWSILESRLGHDGAARELLAKAESQPQSRLATPLALTVAAQIDKQLGEEIRVQYAERWRQARAEKPTPDELLAALETLIHFDTSALRGKRQFVESILPKLKDRALERFDEEHLLALSRRLLDLKMAPSARTVIAHGLNRFPKNPRFPLLLCEVFCRSGSVSPSHRWQVNDALGRARQLATKLPREKQEEIIKQIERYEAIVRASGPVGGLFGGMFGGFGGIMGRIFDDMNAEFDDDGW